MTAEQENDNTPLGERMKRYEHTYRQYLPRRAYTLIRLDGRAFHSYLRGAEKPFDRAFMNEMDLLAIRLVEEISGAQFAYTQSDEISLLVTDFDSPNTEPWFGGNKSKIESVSASLAGAYLARLRQFHPGLPQFDSRTWSMADQVEVANYFIWRQRDAVRNSIQMIGQFHFGHARLHGLNGDQIQDLLFMEKGINWDTTPDGCKRGRLTVRSGTGWQTVAAPHFLARTGSSLANLIPPLPTLEA